LSILPAEAMRKHPQLGMSQILSTYVLDHVLKPRLPDDAVASIAFTSSDLWPGEGWNFVFGQASLADRVGVWSINRLGDPAESDEAFRLTLQRTLKIGAHETGHMFSMAHCVYYECCMNGSNHLKEADAQPLWLCPQCLAKLCFSTGADPAKRFRELAAFAKSRKMPTEEAFWQKSLDAIETPKR
jgi:archaemetzincin